MSELKEIAAEAADLLPGAFFWAETPQGYNYWEQIYLDLLKLAEVADDGIYPPAFESEKRGMAPLESDIDRKCALELADLIEDLLHYFMTPILGGNDPFVRWAEVQQDLFELGGEYPAEGQIPTQAEWEENP